MRTTEQDKTEFLRLFLSMLRAHQTMGRDLEEIIAYMERTIARREKLENADG